MLRIPPGRERQPSHVAGLHRSMILKDTLVPTENFIEILIKFLRYPENHGFDAGRDPETGAAFP